MSGTPWQARRNLQGDIKAFDIRGQKELLYALLDKLEFAAGMEVTNYRDIPETNGWGILFVQTKRTTELFDIVKKLGGLEIN